jgi:hypothetical protein
VQETVPLLVLVNPVRVIAGVFGRSLATMVLWGSKAQGGLRELSEFMLKMFYAQIMQPSGVSS